MAHDNRIKKSVPYRSRIIDWVYPKWLDCERRTLHCKKAMLEDLLIRARDRLESTLPAIKFEQLMYSTENRQYTLFNKLQVVKRKKLKLLVAKKEKSSLQQRSSLHQRVQQSKTPSISPGFAPSFLNLSTIHFSEQEIELLSRGKKHSTLPRVKDDSIVAIILSDMAAGLRADTRLNSTRVTGIINQIAIDISRSSPDTRLVKSISKKVRDNYLCIVKADKGNALIVMPRDDYDRKVTDFLQDSGAKPVRFSIESHSKNIRSLIDSSVLVIPTLPLRDSLKKMSYFTPRLYGQLKLHKADRSIRPVVAFYSDPSFLLARYLATTFRLYSEFEGKFNVKSSIEFSKALKDRTFPPGSFLFVIDVRSMYTNIPVSRAIEIMCKILKNRSLDESFICQFKNLINACLARNICSFNNKTYQFPDGLPMGGPLSALVADVFMCHMEDLIFSSPPSSPVSYWARYVDDIFGVWSGTEADFNSFFLLLNSLHPSIKFSLEKKGDSLSFLDLLIRLTSSSSSPLLIPKFSIFRKETFTGVSIHSSSLHTRAHKQASFHAAVNRLIQIPMDNNDYKNEIQVIKAIAVHNGLDLDVEKHIRRKSIKLLLSESRGSITSRLSKREKWLRLPYLGRNSDLLARELRKYDYHVGFYPIYTLNRLSSLKDPVHPSDSPGVYRLSCADCPAKYIGQTGCSLKKRIAQHKLHYNQLVSGKRSLLARENSAMADHCFRCQHNFNSDAKLLHRCEKGSRLNKLEEYETMLELSRAGNHLLNDLDATFVSPFMRYYLQNDVREQS